MNKSKLAIFVVLLSLLKSINSHTRAADFGYATQTDLGAKAYPVKNVTVAPSASATPYVTAKASLMTSLGGTLNGALICADLDTVQTLVSIYRQYFTDQITSKLSGGQRNLVRQPTEAPEPEMYGCALAATGTRLFVDTQFGEALKVHGILPDRRKFSGVTSYFMVEAKNQETPVTLQNIEDGFPTLTNDPELHCSSRHWHCTPSEFTNVVKDLRRMWLQAPDGVKVQCRNSHTATGMLDCLINAAAAWAQNYPNEVHNPPNWVRAIVNPEGTQVH